MTSPARRNTAALVAWAFFAAASTARASSDAELAAADTLGAFTADTALLAALDELLVDPVRLRPDELERLRVLPWLGERELAALARALPIASFEELEARAGWSREVATRTRPFLAFAPLPAAAAEAWSATLRGDRRRFDLRAAHPHLRIVARRERDTHGGALAAAAGGARVSIGDLRASAGQGLLFFTSSGGLDVGTAAVRRSSGLTATTAAGGMRGIGVEWRSPMTSVLVLDAATSDGVRRRAATLAWRRAGHEVGIGWARENARDGVAAGWAYTDREQRMALELVGTGDGGEGAVMAFERSVHHVRAGLRVQATRGPLLEWAGVEPRTVATSSAVAHLRFAERGFATELDALRAETRRVGGIRVERWAGGTRFAWRKQPTQASLHVVARSQTTRTPTASRETLRETHTHAATAIWRRELGRATAFRVEARARGTMGHTDTALQCSYERAGRVAAWTISLASFAAERRWALTVPGGGDVAVRLRGDGVRAAATTRLAWGAASGTAVVAAIWEDGAQVRFVADAALTLRWPP